MATHASALKAHRQSLKNRERNRQFRSRLRNALRSIRTAIDGNDLSAVAEASVSAVGRARDGQGPSLIECKTYRHRGHSKSDRNRYRSKDEIDTWIARDPIARFELQLLEYGLIGQDGIAAMRAAVEREIEDGIAFAKQSPMPLTADVGQYVYTD